MFKKIISLMLVVCMMFTMAIAVSAAEKSPINAVVSEVGADGKFTVSFVVTPKDGFTISAFGAQIMFDESVISLIDTTTNAGDATGVMALPVATESLEGKDRASFGWMTMAPIAKTEDFSVLVATFQILDTTKGINTEIEYILTDDIIRDQVEFPSKSLVDTREEIAGLTATTVEGKEYTGEAYKAEDLITINKEADDVITYVPAELTNAGEYEITATVVREGFKATEVKGIAKIAKKAIEVTMDDKSMTYGDALPAFTSDAPAGVEVTATVAENPNAGTVAITATANDTTGNYEVTVKPGTLTVAKKAITVTMADKAMTYGDALPEFTSDAPAGVTITPTVAEKPNAGTVAITATAESANYDVTVVPGTLTVAKKAITITAQNEFQVEGNGIITEFKPAIVEGLEEGDEITNIVVGFKGEYADVEGVYATEVKSFDENPNYTVEKVDGVYEIKSALPVVITFGENKKTYGDADGEIVVSGDVDKVTIVRKEAEAAGTYTDAYEVTLKVAEDAETGLPYALTVNNNVFVIEKKVVTIKAKDEKQNLGKGLLTSFKEAEVIGEVEGDEITDIVVGFKGEYADVEGTFAVEVKSYVASDNYIVNTEDGVYTIKKASGRPSGGGSVVKPATKPEDKEDVKGDETDKPAASANIALKENAKEIKFIEGFEDKTFRPDDNATRNDVVSALTALFDVTDVKNAPAFNDTDDAAIKALAAAGVINGYEDGSFKGHNDVTRAEFVKLVAAALKLEAVEGAEANFSDIEGHWAAEWIKTFVGKGYLVGYPDGTFRPEDKITRAEMVVVITRVVGTVDAEAAVNFADVNDAHWAYKYIMNAAK